MKIEDLVREKRTAILRKWHERVLGTYPPDTIQFLKRQKNRFANPVGHTLFQGLEAIIDDLCDDHCQETPSNKVPPFLDDIIRIRAVQDFRPSEAVSFLFDLKNVVREVLLGQVLAKGKDYDLQAFESKIDDMALAAFDLYTQCRDTIHQIRVNEVKDGTYKALRRANLVSELPDFEKPDEKAG